MADSSPIHVTRKDPDLKKLQKRYRKEKDAEIVRRLNIIILMIIMDNVSGVANAVAMSDDTIRRWVKTFNDGGLEALSKKNEADDPRF